MTTSQASPPAAAPVTDAGLPHLSAPWFWGSLVAVLLLFVGLNPIWRPLDMAEMDRNILWSYAPIPLLVLLGLKVEGKLGLSVWFVETLRLTLVKFGITFAVMHVLWSYIGAPGVPDDGSLDWGPAATAAGQYSVQPAPPPTPVGSYETRRVHGVVVDVDGEPVAGAVVAITAGVAPLVFAPPAEPLVLEHDANRLRPGLAVASPHQLVTLRNDDEQLHTVRAKDASGQWLFNRAVVAGTERPVMFERGAGAVLLDCGVPGHDEPAVLLLVASGPFVARTGADGSFVLDDVPSGATELTAVTAEGARQVTAVLTAAPDALRITLD